MAKKKALQEKEYRTMVRGVKGTSVTVTREEKDIELDLCVDGGYLGSPTVRLTYSGMVRLHELLSRHIAQVGTL